MTLRGDINVVFKGHAHEIVSASKSEKRCRAAHIKEQCF